MRSTSKGDTFSPQCEVEGKKKEACQPLGERVSEDAYFCCQPFHYCSDPTRMGKAWEQDLDWIKYKAQRKLAI